MDRTGIAIIGAGVIGLAVARELALSGREVVILEKAGNIGQETSSRNSEVIHAGMHYEPGSLKARLAVEGRDLLYAYCLKKGVAHKRTGKLIAAACPGELPVLEALKAKGEMNGVTGLTILTGHEAREMEPALTCEAALYSPDTGIIDSHGLMVALLADAQAKGATLALRTPVVGGRLENGRVVLETGGEEPGTLECDLVINCAGFSAPGVARSLKGFPHERIPKGFLCKGNYFTIAGKSPFTRLIYPAPESAGLGIHLTLDLGGGVKFGPDVEWVEEVDYKVDPNRGEEFYPRIRKYWPKLPDGALQPGYSGIRAKIQGPGEPAADFMIEGPARHGIKGVINLFGIESPGLTACLAIAGEVARSLG